MNTADSLRALMEKKEPLNQDLAKCLTRSHTLGMILRHPLVVAVPYLEPMNAVYNAQMAHKRSTILQAVKEGQFSRALFLHERPFRLHAFWTMRETMQPMVYWELLREVWMDCEEPHVNFRTWIELFEAEIPHRDSLLDADDHKAVLNLPTRVDLFRGIRNARGARGLSWTTNPEKARWFATRWNAKAPHLCTATVHRRIIERHGAYFGGRGESEVVIAPQHLKQIRKEPV